MDGIRLAKALYKKIGAGATYLLTATPQGQRKEMLKTFINGTSFQLNDKALTQFPVEIFDFPQLTSIDLSGNKITSIPKNIEVFKDLQSLNLANNKLKSIHKNFRNLSNLKNLDLSQNNFMRKFPEIIFDLTQIEKLDITNVTGFSGYIDIPAGIYNLKNLKELKLASSNWPTFADYPSIGAVTGDPINLDPLEVAYASYDQGDKNPIHYIFKYGNEDRILGILKEYYDTTTMVMDLTGVHIEVIPEEITQFKIKKLIVKNCGIGSYYGGYNHAQDILNRIDRRSLKRTAILDRLDEIEEIDLTNNRLCQMADLANLRHLKILNLNQNRFSHFPIGLTTLTNLETLYMRYNYPVSSNNIEPGDFPSQMRNMTALRTLHVSLRGMKNNESYFRERFKKLIPHCEVVI